MKKNILTLISLAALVFSACTKDWLDKADQQTNIATDKWGSTQDLERLINGAYYGISGYEGFRGIIGLQHNHEALLSDLAYLHKNAVTGDWENVVYDRSLNNRNDVSHYAFMYRGAYTGLALANEIIGWVEKNGPFKDQYGPLWTDRIVGEALFLRAWIHFTMVRIHGLPYGADNSSRSIILKTAPSKEPFPNPAPATVQQVYDQILADLDRAATLLPGAYRASIDPVEYQDRANRAAAHFLLARVHFQMKNLEKAKQFADSVLAGNRFLLNQDPIEAWNKTGLGAKGNEVVWQYVQYSTAQQQWKSSPMGYMFGFTARGSNNINGGRLISASDAFLNEVGWSPSNFTISNLPSGVPPAVLSNASHFNITGNPDKRLTQLWKAIPAGYDPRPEFTPYTRTYVWSNKTNRNTTGSNLLWSIPLMRSAEMYLTRAYILFTQGNMTDAAANLNAVRQRAGLPAIAAADLTVQMIHQERMRELAFEDDRLYYLQAIGQPIPAGDRNEAPLDWKSPRFRIPLPNIETDINPNAGG